MYKKRICACKIPKQKQLVMLEPPRLLIGVVAEIPIPSVALSAMYFPSLHLLPSLFLVFVNPLEILRKIQSTTRRALYPEIIKYV
jgi:hypothetical protein